MAEKSVIYEKRDRIARIILNRSEALNALDAKMTEGLKESLSDFDLDPDLWVAIVSGTGRCFCAGADMRGGGKGGRRTTSRVDHYFLDSPVNWKPVIAAVHGYCYGAGLSLAAECDVIVATEAATFSIIETKRGMPAVTLFAQLAAWMGSKKATEMILTGDPLPAEDAYRLGLVNQLVASQEELLPAAEDVARRILDNPPLVVRTAVQMARTSALQSPLHREAELLFRNTRWRDWEDFKEGVRAFQEKRPPVFTGK